MSEHSIAPVKLSQPNTLSLEEYRARKVALVTGNTDTEIGVEKTRATRIHLCGVRCHGSGWVVFDRVSLGQGLPRPRHHSSLLVLQHRSYRTYIQGSARSRQVTSCNRKAPASTADNSSVKCCYGNRCQVFPSSRRPD